MSRFYGSLNGNRGMATRQGTAKSGMQSHTRGWNIGAEVNCYVNDQGQDEVQVVLTGGSANSSTLKELGRFVKGEGGCRILRVSEL